MWPFKKRPVSYLELGTDVEQRAFGRCGRRVMIQRGKAIAVSTCELEGGHEGLCDFEPGYHPDYRDAP